MARAACEGADRAGALVRLRKVAELASPDATNANPAWAQHIRDTADVVQASLDDLAWADAVLFGTPTRFGNPAHQLRAFIDSVGPLWAHGRLADKVYSAFTSSNTTHGGQESTLLTLATTFYHWGGIIVPPGYTNPVQARSANPYGASHTAGDGPPDDAVLEAARYQARRAVRTAAELKAGRAARLTHPAALPGTNPAPSAPTCPTADAGARRRPTTAPAHAAGQHSGRNPHVHT